MPTRWLVLAFVLAVGVLGAGFGYYRSAVMPPDCASMVLRPKVHDILVRQFGLPGEVRYALVRTLEGGELATRFVCDAELVNDLPAESPPGRPRRIVHFESYIDRATGEHAIKAGIRPGPR